MGTHGRRITASFAVAVLAAALALTGCGQHGGGDAAARASAAATSTVAQTGETDAKALVAHCIPASTLAQVKLIAPESGKAARASVMDCMGVPKPDRQAAAACALGNIEHGGKLPAGKQAKELALLDDAYPCVAKYQPHAVPTPSSSAK